MNTRMTTVLALCLSALFVFAEQNGAGQSPVAKSKPATAKKLDPAQLRKAQMKMFGGFVRDTRGQKGRVVVVNGQTAAKEEWMDSVVTSFADLAKITVGKEKGPFDIAKPTLHGDASLFVTDDPSLPMSLVAPESKWAMVNIAPLKTDKPAFFEARVKKELTRAMAYLLGATDSQYPMCLTGCVTKPEDLDKFVTTDLPVDVCARLTKYPEGYGITPYKRTTYKASVREGWGAQPTNEYQKAIWDQVHTLPTNPIKIKYDPKRDK